MTHLYDYLQGTKNTPHKCFLPLFGAANAEFSELLGALHPWPPLELCPEPAGRLNSALLPPRLSAVWIWTNDCTLGTIHHIRSLHKFPYIYPTFSLQMPYNTLYFHLKCPINYPIFCSKYACRPDKREVM